MVAVNDAPAFLITGNELITLAEPEWPHLTPLHYWTVVLAPIVAFILIVIGFCVWPAPPKLEKKAGETKKLLDEGEVAGNYDRPWTQTFDLVFLMGMLAMLGLLIAVTAATNPGLFVNKTFWIYQLPKLGIMIGVSVLCGLLCRRFCDVDGKGYIMTNKSSTFKVNYTRKVQHLAAYLVPLMVKTPPSCHCTGVVETAWGQWFTLLAFLVMIKPIRERLDFFMLQFNSMDRPEDRPHTLQWIIAGNIIWGEILILLFSRLYTPYKQAHLVFIFVYITGIGDGLAEPVGIWFGRHKYMSRSCGADRLYQRSWEGSACVFLSGMIFTSIFYAEFKNATQFWLCFFILAPVMAFAEATSPHTMDTPALMLVGGGLILCFISAF